MGLMPPGTKIAENPPEIPKWDALSDDAKKVLSRQMEVYAGYAEHTDREIGRLIDAIGDLGELDNTIVIYIAGDNGGTAIGGLNGTFNEWSNLNDAPEDIPYLKTRMDEYGGPNSYPNYSVAWAMAGSTPATWCINACQGGGQNQGMVIRWPGGIKSKGEIRRQYTHLIDVGPTILEAVGIPEPKIVNGVEQIPDGRHQHDLLVRRCGGKGSPHRPVQRVQRQSQHLQGRLDGLRDAPRAMGEQPPRR